MIALDTNILVYARRAESTHHVRASSILRELSEGHEPWAIPWPCIYEYLRVVTHPRIFSPPSRLDRVIEQLASLMASPSLLLLGETPSHPEHLRRTIVEGGAAGNLIHDAHIAALVREHGVHELWTTDRDFGRFPGIRVRDPFADEVRETRAHYRAMPQERTRRRARKSARRVRPLA